jgi:ankyrin repeat protein
LEIVKLLLEAGANPNLKDDDGETAMMKTDSEEIKNLLKQYGAKK